MLCGYIRTKRRRTEKGNILENLAFCALIPAENPVRSGQSLNLLLVAENKGTEVTETVRFFGSAGGGFREIWAEPRTFPANSHPHLYFNLPASCFAPENWDGQAPEELVLWAGEKTPREGEQGILLFFDPE